MLLQVPPLKNPKYSIINSWSSIYDVMMLLKLGGSIVTYKGEDSFLDHSWNETRRSYRIREHMIGEIGRELKRHSDNEAVIVHGGGTHGHRTVLRWRSGVVKGSEAKMAWEVKWRMEQLTGRILYILGREGLPVVSVSPSDIMVSNGSDIERFDPSPIRELIERGNIPVLRGDLIPDINGGWSVVSGDDLMVRLSELGDAGLIRKPEKCIMIMKENGFYSSYGTRKQALVRSIDHEMFHKNYTKWSRRRHGNEDATGGIHRKLISCHRIASNGMDAYMIGGSAKNLSSLLSGEGAGTRFPSFRGGVDCNFGQCVREGGTRK